MRPGHDVALVNVSSADALIESAVRLLPGREIELHLVLENEAIMVRGRIVRSYVSVLAAGHIRYRSALAFRDPVMKVDTLPRSIG